MILDRYEVLEGAGDKPWHSVLWGRLFKQKPLAVIHAEEAEEKLPRVLNLFDLLMIGIGGTVGSGIFVLAGTVSCQ